MTELAVTAIGADRPGIVARVTRVLLDHGGNLEDSSMTILGGQFAMMLLVSADVEPATLERALTEATRDLGMVIAVRAVGAGAASPPPTHLLSVYGSDRPGIVHGVTQTLAVLDVNVTDLATRVLEGEQPVYAMMLEISLPEGVTQDSVTKAVGESLPGIEVSIHPLEVETF